MKIYLDLLPQEKKKELKRKKIFRRILREEILFLVPVFVLIAILVNIFYLIRLQRSIVVSAQASDKAQEKFQQLSSYEDKFSKTNEAVAALLKIQAKHLHWEKLFRELDANVPQDVTITEISSKNYQIFLTGKAKTRDNLLELKGKLDSSNCFENVNMPLSDLVTKEDVDFQMDFTITKDCLTK
jgi:Tfp pilus assembly protein PilN